VTNFKFSSRMLNSFTSFAAAKDATVAPNEWPVIFGKIHYNIQSTFLNTNP
jgi:hypothetical protein